MPEPPAFRRQKLHIYMTSFALALGSCWQVRTWTPELKFPLAKYLVKYPSTRSQARIKMFHLSGKRRSSLCTENSIAIGLLSLRLRHNCVHTYPRLVPRAGRWDHLGKPFPFTNDAHSSSRAFPKTLSSMLTLMATVGR